MHAASKAGTERLESDKAPYMARLRRGGLRLFPPAAMVTRTPYHPPHRPQGRRVLAAVGSSPLDHRAHHGLARRLSTPPPTLRTQSRPLPRLHRHRLHPHLLPQAHFLIRWRPTGRTDSRHAPSTGSPAMKSERADPGAASPLAGTAKPLIVAGDETTQVCLGRFITTELKGDLMRLTRHAQRYGEGVEPAGVLVGHLPGGRTCSSRHRRGSRGLSV